MPEEVFYWQTWNKVFKIVFISVELTVNMNCFHCLRLKSLYLNKERVVFHSLLYHHVCTVANQILPATVCCATFLEGGHEGYSLGCSLQPQYEMLQNPTYWSFSRKLSLVHHNLLARLSSACQLSLLVLVFGSLIAICFNIHS